MFEVARQDTENLITENIASGTSVAMPSGGPPITTSSNVAYDVARHVQSPAAAAHGDQENENNEPVYEQFPDST